MDFYTFLFSLLTFIVTTAMFVHTLYLHRIFLNIENVHRIIDDWTDDKYIYKFDLKNNSNRSILIEKIEFFNDETRIHSYNHIPETLKASNTDYSFYLNFPDTRLVDHLLENKLNGPTSLFPHQCLNLGYYLHLQPTKIEVHYKWLHFFSKKIVFNVNFINK